MRPYPLGNDEFVADLVSEVDRVTETVRARFGGLTARQLDWRPAPEAWGVGHCLAHLTTTNELYRESLAAALGDAAPEGRLDGAPLRGRWFGRLFTRMVGPGGMKVKSPRITRPSPQAAEAGALERFLEEQRRLRALVEAGRGRDLDSIVMRSPLASWVRLAASDALRVMVAHELRHLAQAERVVAHPAFPR